MSVNSHRSGMSVSPLSKDTAIRSWYCCRCGTMQQAQSKDFPNDPLPKLECKTRKCAKTCKNCADSVPIPPDSCTSCVAACADCTFTAPDVQNLKSSDGPFAIPLDPELQPTFGWICCACGVSYTVPTPKYKRTLKDKLKNHNPGLQTDGVGHQLVISYETESMWCPSCAHHRCDDKCIRFAKREGLGSQKRIRPLTEEQVKETLKWQKVPRPRMARFRAFLRKIELQSPITVSEAERQAKKDKKAKKGKPRSGTGTSFLALANVKLPDLPIARLYVSDEGRLSDVSE